LLPAAPSILRPDPAGPLPQLRAATRDHHARIDRLVDLRRMRDRRHYADVLQVFDAFLAAWEPALAAALPARWHDWLRARSRRRFLAQDLRALGIGPATFAASVPPLPTEAAAWGSLYVLEGSALGGQVITRSLAEAGLHPHNGTAYFHGWGEATPAMWREFRAVLEAQLAGAGAVDDACEAARRTFDTLSHLLESALHERTSAG
jgi:heme oxygenase (biliverdin-IX-beta and delta-forming)